MHRLLLCLFLLLSGGLAAADTDTPNDTGSLDPDEDVPTGGRTVACDGVGGVPVGLAALAFATAALRRRRVRSLLIAVLALTPVARAQDDEPTFAPRLDAQRFEPCGLVTGFATTCAARQLEARQVSFDALLSYGWRPLQRSARIADTLIRRDKGIEHLGALHLRLGIGATDWLQVAVAAPALQIVDAGRALDRYAGPRAAVPLAVGDVDLEVGFLPLPESRYGVGLSITPFATFPTGSRRWLLTDGTFGFGARLGVSGEVGPAHLALHGGYLVKLGAGTLGRYVAEDDELRYGAGVGFALLPGTVRFNAELSGATIVGPGLRRITPTLVTGKLHTAVEATAGLVVSTRSGLAVTVGAGAGLTPAVGVPAARAYLAFAYVPYVARDRDADGLLDPVDDCPSVPEDLDGFEDDDGCPDDDDDGDGIPDADDACPREPEDFDGDRDDDGCPDIDRDGDGVTDSMDRCPEVPEDRDGFEDADGCPDDDNDGDGIPDGQDGCPELPEDMDGFEDEDGCPELDDDRDGIPDATDLCPREPENVNGVDDTDGCPDGPRDTDGDGILDANDACPTLPEDLDGFGDADGCPDVDDDGDGILDADDACPREAEVRNGVDDEDGCPDEAKARVSGDRIEILEQVLFYVNEARIREASYGVLDAVLAILEAYPDIARVRVEGHTDSQGTDDYNQDLSERRALAVRQYLLDRGVSPTRLLARGFGERYPVASNATDEGRKANRRVEFVILGPEDEGGL